MNCRSYSTAVVVSIHNYSSAVCLDINSIDLVVIFKPLNALYILYILSDIAIIPYMGMVS